MKTTNTKLSLVLMFFGLLFASCSYNGINDEEQPKEETKTVLSLNFPDRFVLNETTKAKYPANAQEKALSTVDIYVFTDVSGTPGLYVSSFPVVLGATNATGVAATVDLSTLAYGTYQLVAVANYAIPAASIVANMPFDDFCDLIITDFPAAGDSFIMSSVPEKLELTKGIIPSINPIVLTRLAVRIDIKNEAISTPNPFVLTHARVVNAVDRSYLIKRGSSKKIGVGSAVDKNLPWVENGTTLSVYNTEMFATLYGLENDEVSPSTTQTYVEVKGKYKGSDAVFAIPFDARSVVRNTRYLIKIQKIVQSEMTFAIEVKDWNEGDIIPFDPSLPTPKQPLIKNVQPILPDGSTVMTKAIVGEYEGVVFKYETGADEEFANIESMTVPFWRTRYDFTTQFNEEVEVIVKGSTDLTGAWVSTVAPDVSGETTTATNPDSEGVYTQNFRIVFEANNLDNEVAREMTLIIQSKTNAASKKEILIKQIALPNPTLSFSKAYLGGLNTFDKDLTETNISDGTRKPAYFQWGRNVPFYATGDEVVENKAVGIHNTSAELFEQKKFYTVTGKAFLYPETTLANGGARSVIWKNLVMRAKRDPGDPDYDAWTAYKGTNVTHEGDPCPEGWHVPGQNEYWSVLLGYKTRNGGSVMYPNRRDCVEFYSDVALNYNKTLESPFIYQWKHRGNAFYHAPVDVNKIYALKHVMTNQTATGYMYENALRTAYKYEIMNINGGPTPDIGIGYVYIKVTSRLIGEGAGKPNTQADLSTIIATDAYWASNDENDKVMLLPADGTLNAAYPATGFTAIGDRPGFQIYNYTSDLLSNDTGCVLRGGKIWAKSNYYPNHLVISTAWSHGTISGMQLRCVKNGAEPGVNQTWSWPTK